MKGEVRIVKALSVNGKLYTSPKMAAKSWVKWALFDKFRKKWSGVLVKWGTPEYPRYIAANDRAWCKKRNKRYAKLVEPIFARMMT